MTLKKQEKPLNVVNFCILIRFHIFKYNKQLKKCKKATITLKKQEKPLNVVNFCIFIRFHIFKYNKQFKNFCRPQK